jgi:hypothetical protein
MSITNLKGNDEESNTRLRGEMPMNNRLRYGMARLGDDMYGMWAVRLLIFRWHLFNINNIPIV